METGNKGVSIVASKLTKATDEITRFFIAVIDSGRRSRFQSVNPSDRALERFLVHIRSV
jgi:hypothetical protein